MKRQSIAAALALCLLALPALADAPRSLRGADCLDPSMARSWTELDNRSILVDAGRRKYRMEISPACPGFGFSPFLGFKGDPVSGRVCGIIGDSIITRDSTCRIERMEVLDKAQYKQALESRKTKYRQKPVAPSPAP